MTTILTEIGWSDENGNLLGTWTNRADLVDEGDEITVASGVTANTLAGDDIIFGRGRSDDSFGIDNSGTIDTDNGNDDISGIGIDDGIINSGKIDLGKGDDLIMGFGDFFGIDNSGTIDTGNGNDDISGSAESWGIDNSGTIYTGNGNDDISGIGESFGIRNSGTIDTGNGEDTVEAEGVDDDVFSGGGTINLGKGDDLIGGFGQQIVDGGQGFDTADLGRLNFDQVTLSNGVGSSIDITAIGATMSFTNVEVFDFNGQEFSLEQLQAEV